MIPATADVEAAVHIPTLLGKVTGGEDLSTDEAEGAFNLFMDGTATPVQMAALLVGLRGKGLAPAEIAGGVRALRSAMVPVPARNPGSLVDTAGTGGGEITTFNISTAAALVAAGAGVRMAKHGNRSFTSRCGSADVLEELGVKIDLEPERMGEIIEEVGIVFMFAPLLHPAMRYVGPVRKELGITTIMNVLGPLTNPAGARRQVVGVADPHLVSLLVMAFKELGHVRGLVVHGSPGMDEISPSSATRVAELRDGKVTEREITPGALGVEPQPLEGLRGGSAAENAQVIRDVLSGKRQDAARSATLLNAAAAIYVGGRVSSLEQGVTSAAASVDSGAAMEKLAALKAETTRSRSS
jgi:anthranilate phosphoribosyltransferase